MGCKTNLSWCGASMQLSCTPSYFHIESTWILTDLASALKTQPEDISICILFHPLCWGPVSWYSSCHPCGQKSFDSALPLVLTWFEVEHLIALCYLLLCGIQTGMYRMPSLLPPSCPCSCCGCMQAVSWQQLLECTAVKSTLINQYWVTSLFPIPSITSCQWQLQQSCITRHLL